MTIGIRCLAMTSKNDYLTAKFFHLNALCKAFTQADIFLRCELPANREAQEHVYFLCTAIVFIGYCLVCELNGGKGRLKFLLQNFLRIFVFDFEPDFAAKFKTYNQTAEHVRENKANLLTEHIILSHYEFTSSTSRPNTAPKDIKIVDQFADLFATLKVILFLIFWICNL